MLIISKDVTNSEWGREFLAYLGTTPYAQRALERFETEGYPRHEWLNLLKEYIASPERLEPGRRAARLVADEAGRCLKALSKSATRVSTLLDKLDSEFPYIGASHILRGIEHTIGGLLETLRQMEKEQRIVGSAKGAGRDEQLLVLLSLGIQRHTGAKHYSELAYLLEAAATAHGKVLHVDPDQVRKVIRRFKLSFPESYKSLQDVFGPSKDQPKVQPAKDKTKKPRMKPHPPIQIEYPFVPPSEDEPGL